MDDTPQTQPKPKPKPKSNYGLECRKCGCHYSRVIYTEPRNGYILRRRECRHCGWRLSTRES